MSLNSPYPTYPVVTPTPTLTGSETPTPEPTVDPFGGFGDIEGIECTFWEIDPVSFGNPTHIDYYVTWDGSSSGAMFGMMTSDAVTVEDVTVNVRVWGCVDGGSSSNRLRGSWSADQQSVASGLCSGTLIDGVESFGTVMQEGEGCFDVSGAVVWDDMDLSFDAGDYFRVSWGQWDTDFNDVDYYVEVLEVVFDGLSVYQSPSMEPTPTPTVTPTPTITPTVTPTPFVGGYCCTVQCQEGNDWEGTIPVVVVGQGTCIEWGGADLSAVGLDPIPPMRVCFAPIRFGDVGILGVSINLDVISVVLSAVVTLRLLWRS